MQNSSGLTFRVACPQLGVDESVWIVGDAPQLGNAVNSRRMHLSDAYKRSHAAGSWHFVGGVQLVTSDAWFVK